MLAELGYCLFSYWCCALYSHNTIYMYCYEHVHGIVDGVRSMYTDTHIDIYIVYECTYV